MKFNFTILHRSQIIIGQNPDLFVEEFYDHFLGQSSELEKVFRNTDLKVQKLELIKGFLTIFSMLDEPKKLEDYLFDLGTRHVCYEVQSHHYSLVESSLIHALKKLHGKEWDDSFEKEWGTLCSLIIEKMKVGSQKVKAA